MKRWLWTWERETENQREYIDREKTSFKQNKISQSLLCGLDLHGGAAEEAQDVLEKTEVWKMKQWIKIN